MQICQKWAQKSGHRKTDGHLYVDFVDPKLVSE